MSKTLQTPDLNELASIFRALADPNRLRILQMLRDDCGGECRFDESVDGRTVSEIARCCEVGLSTVSHHLKELRRAGLIECVRRGQCVCCSLSPRALRALEALAGG